MRGGGMKSATATPAAGEILSVRVIGFHIVQLSFSTSDSVQKLADYSWPLKKLTCFWATVCKTKQIPFRK